MSTRLHSSQLCARFSLLVVFLCSQDVFGADASGGQRGEVHVPLHRALHVGGCGAEEQNHGGTLCFWCWRKKMKFRGVKAGETVSAESIKISTKTPTHVETTKLCVCSNVCKTSATKRKQQKQCQQSSHGNYSIYSWFKRFEEKLKRSWTKVFCYSSFGLFTEAEFANSDIFPAV